MRLLFEIDTQDYDINGTAFVRNSARCITFKNGKVAMVYSAKYNYYKFPGGGIEKNESKEDALIRETLEETGLKIIPGSVKEFGYVHRIQKDDCSDWDCFIQDNYYYLCDVENGVETQDLDDYEADEKFTLEFVNPDEAVFVNRTANHGSADLIMIERDSRVLEILREEGYFMNIRKFREEDANEVSALIAKTLRTTNIKDYSPESIEKEVNSLQPKDILDRAVWTHFYVVCDGDKIIGCGAIGPYWGKEDESSLFTVFVLPEYQGKGIGKKIIQTLEQDEFFLRARRIEIPASITGTPFYIKMGYDYKNGVNEPDAQGLLRLEKFR